VFNLKCTSIVAGSNNKQTSKQINKYVVYAFTYRGISGNKRAKKNIWIKKEADNNQQP
jgi:hypothetical protein